MVWGAGSDLYGRRKVAVILYVVGRSAEAGSDLYGRLAVI